MKVHSKNQEITLYKPRNYIKNKPRNFAMEINR